MFHTDGWNEDREESARKAPPLRAGQIDVSLFTLDEERPAAAPFMEVQLEECIIVSVENQRRLHSFDSPRSLNQHILRAMMTRLRSVDWQDPRSKWPE